MKVKTTTVRRKDEDDANLFISGPAEMADAGVAGSDGEWEEDDERAHNNLMSEISKITKKKKMGLAPRSVRISTRDGGAEVDTQDILKRIGIKSMQKSVKKLQPLPTPLEKVAIRRTKREVGYDKVACEASKWGSLVHKRRAKDQLTFPLQQPDVQVYTTLKTEDIRMKTPLEQEIYTLLQGAKLSEDRKETNEEKEKKRAMSLEELKERNRLAWKQKEDKKRIERKAWMQNKNKSRKFHRLLRRDRLKKQKADLSDLEKKNPEEFLEKLEELERSRVEERMTLRHRHSKWAHLQGLRATRDETAMAALKENQNMHQELVAKRKLDESESEEEEQIEEKLEALKKERQAALETGLFDPSNPWTANLMRQLPERVEMTPESAIDDSFVNFKKFWDEVNRRKLIEKKARDAIAARERAEKESSEEEEGDDDGSEKDDGVKENGDVALVEMKESDGEDKAENSGETKDAGNLTNGGDISKKKKMKKKKGQKMKGKENVKDKESENKLKLNDENVSKVEKLGTNEKDNEKKKRKNTKKKQEKLKQQTSGTKETEIEKDAAVENMDAKDDGSQENVEKSDKKVLKKNAAKKGKLKTQEKKKKINSDADDKQIQSKKKKAGKNKQKKEAGNVDGEDGNDDLEEQLVCIDNMFAQAELGLQKKLKKKLEKLGIDASGDKEWTKVTSKKKKNKKEDRGILPKIEEFDFTITKDEDNLDEGLDRAQTLEDMDVLQNKSRSEDLLQKAAKTLGAGKEGKEATSGSHKKPPPKIAEVDPSKFLQVDTKLLQAAMPDTISRGVEGLDDDEDDEDDAEDILREAFAEDYLVGEFKSEKNEAIEKDKPQSSSLVLPGWGEWTGPNIKVSRRKRRQFTFRAPPAQPRKDDTMGNVLYNEKADVHDNLRKALVSELPYPFSRVQDFEASVRAPIGRLFVPEKEHQKLIAPPVITKMGCIIEPMNEEELLSYKYLSDAKERKNKQSVAKGRKNKQGKKNSNNKRSRNNDGNTSQKLLKINQ